MKRPLLWGPRPGTAKVLLLLCFFLCGFFYAYAADEASADASSTDASAQDAAYAEGVTEDISSLQQNSADAAADAVSDKEAAKTESDYIEMDIKTSSLMELAAWCRELGLSEGGAKDDLASRLRTYYNLPQAAAAPADQKIITIESAKTTEYFTIDVVNEEYARLKGDVIISLKDGNAVHRIKAWEILYNRTRNVLTATGKVEYVKEEGDTVETFKGDSITVNLDNWSSIFVDGVSERSISGNTTAYRFAGTVISRNSEDVTVLTGADITNPVNDEAYWSLHASKLWLLPGNDWAILNAVLKVGNIPLLYVPFFYYPSDEIVFHPVLGYRSREGTFLQTTTYVLGRPKTEAVAENSITKIFGSASENMEKKREGVFLRTTGEKRQDPNDTRLSLIFDAYVNLGVYLGTELALPRNGALGEINVSAGFGFTRNVYQLSNAFTPFPRYDSGDSGSEWNSSRFFSLGVPFRYRFKVTGSYQIKYGSFSWILPYYSDPYVDRDFMRRSEVLDWLSMLREGAAASPDDLANDTYLSSYDWTLSGSLNPPVTSLAPYITSLSISSISSSLTFNFRDSANYYRAPSDPNAIPNPLSPPNPGKSFFFPSRFTIFSVSASVSGTPYKTGTATQTMTAVSGPAPGDALLPDTPISPWESAKTENTQAKDVQDMYTLAPPVLSQRFDLPATGGPQFSLDYRFAPTTATEMQFRSSDQNWKEQDDINWGEISSILSRFRGDGNLNFGVSQAGGGAYSSTLRLSGTGAWQDYSYLNKDAEEFTTGGTTDQTKVQAARNRAYTETYFTSSWDLLTTIKPFTQSTVWGNTNLQYNVRGLLAKTTVDTSGSNPEWDWVYGKWDKTNLDTNQVTANVAANIMDYNQSLSISAVLPPKDSSASANATFRAWISETGVRGSVRQPWDNDLRTFDPLYVTETLRFGTWGNFMQSVVFDPQTNQYTTLTSNLTLSGFTAAYSLAYARPYRFNPSYGSSGAGSQDLWLLQNDERLEPRELRLGYSQTVAQNNLWGKRFSFSANVASNISFDLQRYTNSKLSFNLSVTMGIANFLDLSLSTTSENVVVYRYFQNLPFFDSPPTELYSGYENNFFLDLLNSFRFDKVELRRKSGFKMKALNLSLVHHLGDWNAKLSMNMTPYLPQGSRTYKFNNEISFLVQWVPIEEIKTEIDYSKEKLTVK